MVGKAKLQAYMLKLQTVNKLSVAQEIRDQTLKETQEMSNALIAAEQRIGELLLSIPKQTGNQYTNASSPDGEKPKNKSDIASEMGYTRKNVDEYQQMAKHPEVVQRVINDALANGEVVTKSQVLKEIKAEREKLKAEMQDLREERDYLQQKLEEEQSREPEVKVVEKKVEVMPSDYEKLKEELETARQDMKVYEDDLKKARDKADKSAAKVKELESKIGSDKSKADATRDIQSFTDYTNDYLRRYGGHVWAFEKFNSLPESVKADFVNAIKNLDGFAQQLIVNLEGKSGVN